MLKPYYENENGRLYCGDNVELFKLIEDNSIDLTITSPPYDNLRKYDGYSFDFESVAEQLYRVTKKGGVVVWVVADATINGSETGTSFKQALFFLSLGFKLHDTMIYAKNNPTPLTHNRYEQQFEYMFILSKGKLKTFNPIKEQTKTFGKKYSWKNTNDYGEKSAKRSRDETTSVNKTKIMNNIWFFNVENDKNTNSAPFPKQLVSQHIISWSNENDIVLDPFMGSGTTGKMCEDNNRRWIGFEISEKNCLMSKNKIDYENRQLKLF